MDWKGILERVNQSNGDEKVFYELRKSSKHVLVYGCSNYSEIIYTYLKNNDIKIEAFVVDKPYWKHGLMIDNRPVKCIDDYDIEKYNIVVGFGDVNKSRFLMNSKSLLKTSFYFLWDPVMYYKWDTEYVENNWDALLNVYNGLADEQSKITLYELIISKINQCCTPQLLAIADGECHYFNRLTFCHNTKNEIFLDCGAYTGDTILQYNKFTAGKYKKIYAFEPNKEFIEDLRNNLKILDGVEIIEKGTWNRETVLKLKSDKEISHITDSDDGNCIKVTTIDKAVKEEDKITFIKMDIEGSELRSLQGAIKTIKRDMPKMAICCYHKKDDIIELFRFMKENCNIQYKIYLRHHSNSSCETILYGIPYSKN